MLQPIGLTKHTTEPEAREGLKSDATWTWVGEWAKEMMDTGRCDDPCLMEELHDEMFLKRDFVFSVTRQDIAKVSHPLVVLTGRDIFHPSETAREISKIAPQAELVPVWRNAGPEKLQEAKEKITRFLSDGDL